VLNRAEIKAALLETLMDAPGSGKTSGSSRYRNKGYEDSGFPQGT
jgi:hypothetical protein